MWPDLPWFRIGAGLVLCVALFTGVQSVRHAYTQRDDLKAQVETLNESMGLLKRAQAASLTAVTNRAADKVRIVTVTKEITSAIPQLVPAGAPALPPGWRVLHDSAAAGIPLPTGGVDAQPVPPETAARTVAENYGTCLDTSSQLERLQQWIRDQSLTSPKASAP